MRDCDHREVIYNDEYINAIYIGQEYTPAWRKYKHRATIGSLNAYISSGSTYPVPIFVDLENKFIHIDDMHTFRDNWIEENPKREDYVYIPDYVSPNGHDFKYRYWDHNLGGEDHKFGTKYTCRVNNYTESYDWNTAMIEVFDYVPSDANTSEETLRRFAKIEIPNPFGKEVYQNNGRWVGTSKTGIFYAFSEQYKEGDNYTKETRLYHVTISRATHVYTEKATSTRGYYYINSIFDGTPIQCHGNRVYTVHAWDGSETPKMSGVYVSWTTTSNYGGWQNSIIVPQYPTRGSHDADVVYRNGMFYAYHTLFIGTGYKVECYTSSNLSSWSQVSLPNYVDVPILKADENHGKIDTTDYTHLRLILDNVEGTVPNQEGYYQEWAYIPDYMMLDSNFNFEIIDGKTNADEINEHYMAWAQFGASRDRKYILWFMDSNTFQQKDTNFAFITPKQMYNGIGEKISDDDYIFEGDMSNGEI